MGKGRGISSQIYPLPPLCPPSSHPASFLLLLSISRFELQLDPAWDEHLHPDAACRDPWKMQGCCIPWPRQPGSELGPLTVAHPVSPRDRKHAERALPPFCHLQVPCLIPEASLRLTCSEIITLVKLIAHFLGKQRKTTQMTGIYSVARSGTGIGNSIPVSLLPRH